MQVYRAIIHFLIISSDSRLKNRRQNSELPPTSAVSFLKGDID
ncbi:hypothetical protein [Tolypothrix tenuis]